MTKTILLIGTYDTKDDELRYVAERIKAMGGKVLRMDVSVLGDPTEPTIVRRPCRWASRNMWCPPLRSRP